MKDLSKERIEALHANYGKASSADISLALKSEKIIPVFPYHDVKGKKFGPHQIDDNQLKRIIDDPREDLFFLSPGKFRPELKDFKTIVVLIETVSGLPAFSVGEVFDQLTKEDKEKAKGFYFDFDSVISLDLVYSLAYVVLYK